ncbi:MAG: hypothetical protein KKE64_04165, partial [Candidatus Omnitrophica bacterium]|nr:hypothetical protein [Candidatus Omnitrophota bacterium]
EKVLRTFLALDRNFREIYSLHGRFKDKAIVLWGRYRDDIYDGINIYSIGNPWFITTLWRIRYLMVVIKQMLITGQITIETKTHLEFLATFGIDTAAFNLDVGNIITNRDTKFLKLIDILLNAVDKNIETILQFIPPNGSISEQINRTTGVPQGARNLIWSHREMVRTAIQRKNLLDLIKQFRRDDCIILHLNSRAVGAKIKNGRVISGTFKDIERMFPKIKELGFGAVYLMGIHPVGNLSLKINREEKDDPEASLYFVRDESGQIISVIRERFFVGDETRVGSCFSVADYLAVNPELGAIEDFKRLVTKAHSIGLKVIIDFVGNHTAADSKIVEEHPEYYIHRTLTPEEAGLSDKDLLDYYPGYFVHYSRKLRQRIMVAHGKHPDYAAWTDTAQLDYTNPDLRQYMLKVIKFWLPLVDGLRCDAALLLFRNQIRAVWYPSLPEEEFNRRLPKEFCEEMIKAVKSVNPGFIFIAESFGLQQGEPQQHGFDITYDKYIYDLLAPFYHNLPGAKDYLRRSPLGYLQRCLHFIENHDTQRARIEFKEAAQAVAAILYTIPGNPLFYQGQIEGATQPLTASIITPGIGETVNLEAREFYRKLLCIINEPVFRYGNLSVLDSPNEVFAYVRHWQDKVILILVNYSDNPVPITLSLKNISIDIKDSSDIYYFLADKLSGNTFIQSGSDLLNNGFSCTLKGYQIFILDVASYEHSSSPIKRIGILTGGRQVQVCYSGNDREEYLKTNQALSTLQSSSPVESRKVFASSPISGNGAARLERTKQGVDENIKDKIIAARIKNWLDMPVPPRRLGNIISQKKWETLEGLFSQD